MNYIESIFLKADNDILIELNNHANVIYGYSSSGKTLLFKLIEFVLGKEELINVEEAKKQFSGLLYVEIKFSKGQVLRRNLNTDFEGYCGVADCGSDKKDKNTYRKFVGSIFNHRDVKIINNATALKTTSLTVAEFINTFFFNESKISDSRPFYKYEGVTQELKLKNYFKYFLTGKVMLDEDLKQRKEEIVFEKKLIDAQKFFKQYKKLVKEPTAKQRSQIKNLPLLIEACKNSIEEKEKEKEEITSKIYECNIMLDKFLSLKDLYRSQLEDLKCSAAIDTFMATSWIECENCGNRIMWEGESNIKEEVSDLKTKIEDLIKLEADNRREFSELSTSLDELFKKIEREKISLAKQESDLNIISSLNEEYMNYDKAQQYYFEKEKQKDVKKSGENPDFDIDAAFFSQIDDFCSIITSRLKAWGLPKFDNVSFNKDEFEFTFDGTLRHLLAKGYKSFCTTAMIIELVFKMKSVGVPTFDFILIDTVWQVSDFEGNNEMEISKNYLDDVSKLDLQFIIFENKTPENSNDNCKFIDIAKVKT